MKQWKKVCAAVCCAGMLNGCSFISVGDELLQVPKPSASYLQLQKELDKNLSDTVTYTAPQSGQYRNSVIFEDIDADGSEESFAFLRDSVSGKITVYAYRMVDERYELIGSIDGNGTALDSVAFLDMPESGGKGMILTWKLVGEVSKGLTVCALDDNGGLKDVLNAECSDYTACDLDQDGGDELFTVRYSMTDRNTAQVYDYNGEKMEMISQIDASQDIKTVAKMRRGYIDSDTVGVFVDNKFDTDVGMQTDIYMLNDRSLVNLAISDNTYRPIALYYSEDVNRDAIIEVPIAKAMKGYEMAQPAEKQWMLDWYRYSLSKPAERICTTYRSSTEMWEMTLTDAWRKYVTVKNVSSAESGVSQTVFYEHREDSEDVPLLTILVYTGSNHKTAAASSGVVKLGSTDTATYAARIENSDLKLSVTAEQVKKMFRILLSSWN
ncbi:MAG: hypothetical protein ACI3XY_06595 [Butyricicoccaceae bacterium]